MACKESSSDQRIFPSGLPSICAAVKGLKPRLILNSQISLSFQLLACLQKRHLQSRLHWLHGLLNPCHFLRAFNVFICCLLRCVYSIKPGSDSVSATRDAQIKEVNFLSVSVLPSHSLTWYTSRCHHESGDAFSFLHPRYRTICHITGTRFQIFHHLPRLHKYVEGAEGSLNELSFFFLWNIFHVADLRHAQPWQFSIFGM